MPHGTRWLGEVEVIALCDAVVRASEPASESFPGGAEATWAEARERYPEAFEGDRWRLHIHCFAIRSRGRTVLVDTGIGPESAPAFAWSGERGRLPQELAAAGVDPSDVERVLITHVHDDHLGWNVAEGTTTPLFANASYVVHRADWELMRDAQDEEDREIFAAVLAPLETAGRLELSGSSLAVTEEITLLHAPGHTPGHQVVLIDSGDQRAIVSADTVNHPAQLLQPGLNGTSDLWPDRAAATRAELLDRIDREGRLVSTSHLEAPFGRFVRSGDRWRWAPE